MKKRIWELDAFRGLCVLGMVIVHLIYDLVELTRLVQWEYPAFFVFIKQWGGVLFLLISGICITLGSRCIRRGLVVFACGMICSLVTYGMYRLNFAGKGLIIYFGVLHCLGICMLLWPVFRRFPSWLLALTGAVLVAAGFYVASITGIQFPWLMPLGLRWEGFVSSDYFPLLPNLGFFLLGATLGRTLYRKQSSLFPGVNTKNPAIAFLSLCGKHSLWIYLLHQPLLSGICYLILFIQSK